MKYIFGPVPSRRLGRSLGIDVVPAKTCSFDCLYCESGPTDRLSVKRSDFASPDLILGELNEFFGRCPEGTDILTFSSAGEPTLYLGLGELIAKIKESYPAMPVAVLTNGSLLWKSDVRRDLLGADIVVPSLDAVTPEIFAAINRPHPSLEIAQIMEGISHFRSEYSGRLHIEIMLVSGLNDGPDELSALARQVAKTGADRIELNTVVRPPAHGGSGLSLDQMERAASYFPSGKTSVIGDFSPERVSGGRGDLAKRIIETVGRRPCTVGELSASLGVTEEELREESGRLLKISELVMVQFDGKSFLCIPGREG